MQKKPLAILVDAENIAASHYPFLSSEIKKLGTPLIFRLFGDFSGNHLLQWLKIAKEHSLEIEMQVSGGKGKNSADILMSIHAMDILHSGLVEGICLVTNDRDFTPLALRLKASHMRVHGFGDGSGNARLREACDNFFVLKCKPKARADQKSNSIQADAKHVVAAMEQIIADKGENGWVGLAIAASAMRHNHPAVADKICGKGKFLKYIRATNRFDERGEGATMKVHLQAS